MAKNEDRRVEFKVSRSHAGVQAGFSAYSLDATAGMTVLEALIRIRSEQDGSLAFRHACRGAVCGSCAMRINGAPELACRTLLSALGSGPVLVEPLAGLRVLKDLAVDMGPFFAKVRALWPWLLPADPDPERERKVEPAKLAEGQPFAGCILCGSCESVCPASARDPEYPGPAALASMWRLLSDPRDGASKERLDLVAGPHGAWACDMVWNCVKACPKGVPPTKGIARMRNMLLQAGKPRPEVKR